MKAWSPNNWIAEYFTPWQNTEEELQCTHVVYFSFIFQSILSLFEGLGLKWTDGAWSAVNTAERLKKQQDMQILLYKDLVVTDWHSCYLLPLTVTLLRPTRQRMSSSDRHQGCLLHMDRQRMCCELQGKTQKNSLKPAQPLSCPCKGQGLRPTEQEGHSSCKIHFPRRLSLSCGWTSVLWGPMCHFLHISPVLTEGFAIPYLIELSLAMSIATISTLKISENAPEWKDIPWTVLTAC